MAGRFSVQTVFKAVDRVTAPVSRMQQRVLKFTRATERGLHKVDRALGAITRGMAGIGRAAITAGTIGVGGLTAAVGLLVREFSKVEDAQAAFTPILGGAKKARDMVQAINDTAASTPFQFENLAASVKQLLPVMGGDIGNIIKTVRMLGDTAGGNAQKLDSITRGYTKAMLKGKVDMESLNMIAEAGVPIFTELAAVMGMKTGERFFKTISKGRVTTDQLTKAFGRLTGRGGKFFGGMEISSRTISGLWSTLKDNISLTAAELGSTLAPVVKDLIRQSIEVAQKVRDWTKANRALISEKVAKWAGQIKDAFKLLLEKAQGLNSEFSVMDRLAEVIVGVADAFRWLRKHAGTIGKIIATVIALSAALKVLSATMAVVNIVMAANPLGLIVLALAAMVAGVAAAIIWWDDLVDLFSSIPGYVKSAAAGLLGPIGPLINAARMVIGAWQPVADFFSGIVEGAGRLLQYVPGFGDQDEGAKKQSTPSIVSPQDRTAQSVEERRTTSTAEVTIKDDTGRAEVTRGTLGAGVQLQQSGAF